MRCERRRRRSAKELLAAPSAEAEVSALMVLYEMGWTLLLNLHSNLLGRSELLVVHPEQIWDESRLMRGNW